MIDSKKGIHTSKRREAREEASRDASVRVREINCSNSKEQ
jgi:hypothetical protein